MKIFIFTLIGQERDFMDFDIIFFNIYINVMFVVCGYMLPLVIWEGKFHNIWSP